MKTIEELKHFFEQNLVADLAALEGERKKVLQQVVLADGAVIVFSIGLIFSGLMPIEFIIFGVVAALGLHWVFTRQYRSEFKDKVIAPLVKFFDEGLSYDKNGLIGQLVFQASRIYLQRIDRYRGDDLVRGMLGKTQIEFSELHAEYMTVTRDSKGRTRRQWDTIFKGLFFVADFNKNFTARTVVLPDTAERMLGGIGKFFQSKNLSRDALVKLEDPEFEKEFVVYSQDQIEARYILSMSLMRRIVEFRKKVRKRIALSFVSSKVFIAIPYAKNLFEPNIFRSLYDFAPVEEYFNDLKMALEIVEELNLNTRIWGK